MDWWLVLIVGVIGIVELVFLGLCWWMEEPAERWWKDLTWNRVKAKWRLKQKHEAELPRVTKQGRAK